jgi:hypothetical protein
LAASGLPTRTMFSHTQATGYNCGHNSAGWAMLLRALGAEFTELDSNDAAAINTMEFAGEQNIVLGKPVDATDWLSGDDIVTLVTHSNPDSPGTEAGWLRGPGPLNFWYTFFAQTVATPNLRSQVHIMVVNTEVDRGVPSPSGALGGAHWFVVAWLVEPPSAL